jgi:hypothetical protein
MTRSILAGAVLFVFAGVANAATTPVQPSYGTYNMVIYDLSQTGASCGGGAGSGSGSPGTFYYPGPAATGTMLVQVKDNASSFGFTTVSLPKTPAAGVKTWSGSFSAVEQPAGKSLSGTFKGTFTFVDAHHFLLVLKITEGGCVQTKQIAAYSTSTVLGAAAVQRP